MPELIIRTAPEQAADYLKEELLRGRWTGTMPGQDILETELGVSRETIRGALVLLEKGGFLESQGTGRRRLITVPDHLLKKNLKVKILLYEHQDKNRSYVTHYMHLVEKAGYSIQVADKDLHDLKMDADKVAKYVSREEADAWIVHSAPQGVLSWFGESSVPGFAVLGRMFEINIAGVSVSVKTALESALDRLVALGHRRIVWLARKDRLKPRLARTEQFFFEGLKARGIPTGPFNLPEWEDSPEGMRDCLKSLFQVTPPTALFICDSDHVAAVQLYLSQLGVQAPEDVSLICADRVDGNASSRWIRPNIAHCQWSTEKVPSKILRWLLHLSEGKVERRQSIIHAKLREEGTFGQGTLLPGHRIPEFRLEPGLPED